MTCCNVMIPNNKISLCILPMAECSGGPQAFWYFGYFLTIWAYLSKQLTGYYNKQFTQNYKIMIQWRKIISFDFHHIPKLSIGFNILKYRPTFASRPQVFIRWWWKLSFSFTSGLVRRRDRYSWYFSSESAWAIWRSWKRTLSFFCSRCLET